MAYLNSMSLVFAGIQLKFFQKWELKILLMGSSARCSPQTLNSQVYLASNTLMRVCDGQTWLAQMSNRTLLWFTSKRLFLPIIPLQATVLLPLWALKSCSRIKQSLVELIPATLIRTPRKLGTANCHLACRPNSHGSSPLQKAYESYPLIYQEKLQCKVIKTGTINRPISAWHLSPWATPK